MKYFATTTILQLLLVNIKHGTGVTFCFPQGIASSLRFQSRNLINGNLTMVLPSYKNLQICEKLHSYKATTFELHIFVFVLVFVATVKSDIHRWTKSASPLWCSKIHGLHIIKCLTTTFLIFIANKIFCKTYISNFLFWKLKILQPIMNYILNAHRILLTWL